MSQPIRIPVDTLNHFAWEMRGMNRHIELDTMASQIDPWIVGRPSAHFGAEIHHPDGQGLAEKGDPEKDNRRKHQGLKCPA